MHDTLAGRGRIQYADYSPDEVKALEERVRLYIEGETDQMEILSLKMVHESFAIMRKMIHSRFFCVLDCDCRLCFGLCVEAGGSWKYSMFRAARGFVAFSQEGGEESVSGLMV